ISARKLVANRANAGKSTGPRTAEGKQKSCQNSWRTGVYARCLLSSERKMFEQELEVLRAEFPPKNLLQEQQLEDRAMAGVRWRRGLEAETGSIMAAQAKADQPDQIDELFGLLVDRPTAASLTEMAAAVHKVRTELETSGTLSQQGGQLLERVIG